MAILAAGSSQNNTSGNGRYVPLKRRTDAERKVGHFDCTDLMGTLNAIDERNIRTTFKQAKDPVLLAFDHINSQPLKKVATDAIKESVCEMKGSIEDFKDAAVEIKSSLGEFVEFIGKIFTSGEEFIPEQI